MGYNVRSISGFFLPFGFEFSAFLISFSIKHLISSSSPAPSVHPLQIGVFHMIYIINVKAWIDHIFHSISGAFSLFSFVHCLAISFVGHFVGEIL